MSIELRIICDGCNQVHSRFGWSRGPTRRPVHQLRNDLRKLGWSVGRPGGEDLCPDCRWAKLEEK